MEESKKDEEDSEIEEDWDNKDVEGLEEEEDEKKEVEVDEFVDRIEGAREPKDEDVE